MVSIGEIRRWDTAALGDIVTHLTAQDGTALQLEGELHDHGRLEEWDGKTRDAARAAIEKVQKDIGSHMEMLTAVKAAVSRTQAQVGDLKRKVDGLDLEAGGDGFAITDDGAVDNLWGYPPEPGDDQGHQLSENRRRQQHREQLITAADAAMVEGNEIEQESAAAMLDAVGAGALGQDGKLLGIDGSSGRKDGEDARDGNLSPEAAARLGSIHPTPEQLAALQRGEEIVIGDHQMDYLREFYNAAGKDGILSLTEHLTSAENANSPAAQTTLASVSAGLQTLSNEDVRTPTNQHGSFAKLPKDFQELVSTRYWGADKNAPKGRDGYDGDKLDDSCRDLPVVAKLLEASKTSVPGAEFALNLDRQVTSLLDIQASMKHQNFPDEPLNALESTATSLLDAGTRNHEASAIMLTFKDPIDFPTRDAFANAVFTHEWADDGRAASKLFDWTAEASHTSGPDGRFAQDIIKELPRIFVPNSHDGGNYSDQDLPDGAASIESFANSFKDNPALADAMSRVISNNLDVVLDPSAATGPSTDGSFVFDRVDGDRLLFLASQSDTGVNNLFAANELYRNEVLSNALNSASPNISVLNNSLLATLDSRITESVINAHTFQHAGEVDAENAAAKSAYEAKSKVANIIADVAEIPLGKGLDAVATRFGPLSDVASAAGDAGISAAREAAIEAAIGKEPEPKAVDVPNPDSLAPLGERQVLSDILAEKVRNGTFVNEYFAPDSQPVDVSRLSTTDLGKLREALGPEIAEYAADYGRDYNAEISNHVFDVDELNERIVKGHK
jgi:hypothetical protein